jgi:hypothetical protein
VISLTPQRSATQPGVVDILARFQVKGSTAANSLNFQVAVPKVSRSRDEGCEMARRKENYLLTMAIFITTVDSTAADAADVASRHQPRSNRNTANAHYCARWCKFQPFSRIRYHSSMVVVSKTCGLTNLLLCPLHSGQPPATSTSIVFNGWAAHPRSSGLFWISAGSDGIKMRISSSLLCTILS